MNPSEPVDDGSPIERQAADWLARRVDGLSPPEQRDLQRWLADGTENARVFAELEQTWAALDGLRNADSPTMRRLEAGLPSTPALEPSVRWRSHTQVWLGAAAAIALVFVLWRLSPSSTRPVAFEDRVQTDVGEQRQLPLPDGSTVAVNTDTSLQIDFNREQRRVRLMRGEAKFIVAKDPSRPFWVEVERVAVRAVGTAFNVRCRDGAVEVLITEGKVRVLENGSNASLIASAGTGEEPLLHAGEKVVIPLAGKPALPAMPRNVSEAEVERSLAWQDRRLVFDDTPLGQAVAEFNRYNRHKLVLGDPRLNDRRFDGAFEIGNQAAFVRLLEDRFRIRAERRTDETVLWASEE